MKHYVALISCAFILTACGGGSSGGGTPKSSAAASSVQSQSSSESIAVSSSSVESSSSSSSSTQTVSQYCDPHTAQFSSYAANNLYAYVAESNNCFGIREDVYQRKTVPLIISEVDDDIASAPFDLHASTHVKISAIPNRLEQNTYYFTFEITNDGVIPYCSLRITSLSFLNDTDQELLKINSTHVVGDTFQRVNRQGRVSYEEDCIAPGATLTVFGYTPLGDIDINSVTQVVTGLGISRYTYLASSDYHILPKLTPQEMSWNSSRMNSAYPGLYVSLMNPLDYAIRLRDNAIRTLFFDDEGYVVGNVYVWLYEGLEKDEIELTDSDYVIPASGGLLLLADDIADIAAVTPSTAKKVFVFVDWTPEI
jgi:hypothetical protein